MSQETPVVDPVDFEKEPLIDMRTSNGLTRRSVATLEEGNNKDDEWEKSSVTLSSPSNKNAFRDVAKLIANSGPMVFLVFLVITFFATLRSSQIFRTSNTFINFLHVWATITLMILSIMGLMHASKLEGPEK